MSADESRLPTSRRARPVEQKQLPIGPARDLRDAIYRLYAEADRPPLAELAQRIADDDDLPGSPGKDLIGKVISGDGLAGQQDTVTVAVALAKAAGRGEHGSIAEHVRGWWIAAATAATPEPDEPAAPLGQPIRDCDPLTLEVHPAIQFPGSSLGALPTYVPRAHDSQLQALVDRVLSEGSSRLITLVGGSSTGKTRACWELACYLDKQQPRRWRLWHPYDPTRLLAALADLDQAAPYTVVWLNEAQHYLMPTDPGLAEHLAAALRSLLHDVSRAPVLVLVTMWPDYWHKLTAQPPSSQPDQYAQARELLTGTAVKIADVFTPTEIGALLGAGVDPRVRYAAAHAEGARVTQYLAGAPELEIRYRTAGPAARAIIQVAIDARRLGHPPVLPHALLERAAPGYLDDHEWDGLEEDWLEQALAYTARPCKGARGPLTRIRSRPGKPVTVGESPCYRLADYLEQFGAIERDGSYPPEDLWAAFAATVIDPGFLRALGDEARRRGRHRHAIGLYRKAADRRDIGAMQELTRLLEQRGETAGAVAVATEAADCGDTGTLRALARTRERAGDSVGAEAIYRLAAARGDPYVLQALAGLRERAGDAAGAEALAVQAADRGNVGVFWALAKMRELVGDAAGADDMAAQAADRGNSFALHSLAQLRKQLERYRGGGTVLPAQQRPDLNE